MLANQQQPIKLLTLWIASLLTLTLVTGCATSTNYQRVVNRWQGASMQDLIHHWGPPDAMVKQSNGHMIYTYKREQLFTIAPPAAVVTDYTNVNGTPMYGGGFIGGVAGQTVTRSCRTWFETNPQGIILNAQFQGDNCVASPISGLAP